MRDWRPVIVELVSLKQAIDDADTQGLWEYHLPKVAASDDTLAAVEATLGFRLDPQYREFLQYANGWPSFYQSVDLFGTDDLAGGPRLELARQLLDATEPVVLERVGYSPEELFPIAATTVDLDLFVTPITGGQQTPPVIWLAGSEVDRYPSFEEYVLAMVEYNRLELASLIEKAREQ